MAKKDSSRRIADILVANNLISEEILIQAQEESEAKGTRLERYLVDKSLVKHEEMTLAIAEYLRMQPVVLSRFTPNTQLIELVPKEMLVKRLVLPLARLGKHLTVALGDPFDLVAIDELATLTGYEITALVASEKEVQDIVAKFAQASQGSQLDIEEVLRQADEDFEVGHEKLDDSSESIEASIQSAEGAPVIRMVNMILLEALRTGASDIHLEPMEKQLVLRYRIDGDMSESPSPPKSLQGAITSRFKLMSGMDISERRIPQDGRIKMRAMNKTVDLRVNTLPTIHGEKICMRILDKSSLSANLAALGLDPVAQTAMRHAIEAPNGIVLVTGPTGSGKTTTLYSCLQELNTTDVNIVTCEDPVEYQLEGINQVQINSLVGLTFGAALRSILRQDPDIVLIGEIRDNETAEIAVKAALTGHLVLSTLHTNSAAGAITRMADMGVDPALLAQALRLSQAQRLCSRLCTCKKPTKELSQRVLDLYKIDAAFFEGANLHAPNGCPKCRNSGYKGRIAVMEVLPMSKSLRQDIVGGANATIISERARAKGMLTLKDVGLAKVKEGLTSLEAALAVTGGD